MTSAGLDTIISIRRRTFSALLACLIAASAGYAEDLSFEAKRGGELNVAINSDILSLNPGVRRDGNTDTVLYHVAEALVAYRDDLTVAPLLAEAVEVSEDGLVYTFHLRDNVKFHNGEQLSSEHVLWSWKRILNPSTGFRCLDYFDGSGASGLKIDRVIAPDAMTVTMFLNLPSTLFLDRMANIQCLTAILHQDSVDESGRMLVPIGTGPYKVDEWRKGQYVRLVRHEQYASRKGAKDGLTGAKKPYLDAVRFVITPDRIAAKTAVYAGGIDLVFAVPLNIVEELKQRAATRGDIKLYYQPTLDWTVLLMQNSDPVLQDVRMRRAIGHAISIDLATEIATYGLAEPNPSAVQHISPFHRLDDDRWLSFDPALAKVLAQQAGYRGEVLTIQTNRKFSYMYDNAISTQAMLIAAGFNVKIEVTDWATQLSKFLNGDFQLSSFGYSARSHPALLYGNFTGIKNQRDSYQWENAEAISLIAQLEKASSDGETFFLLRQLHELMIEDVPLIGLYNDEVVDLSKANVMGYTPWAFGRPRLWGVWLSEGHDHK